VDNGVFNNFFRYEVFIIFPGGYAKNLLPQGRVNFIMVNVTTGRVGDTTVVNMLVRVCLRLLARRT
jgi:hypothetical protein